MDLDEYMKGVVDTAEKRIKESEILTDAWRRVCIIHEVRNDLRYALGRYIQSRGNSGSEELKAQVQRARNFLLKPATPSMAKEARDTSSITETDTPQTAMRSVVAVQQHSIDTIERMNRRAAETQSIAADTAAELQIQGEALQRAEKDVDHIEVNVKVCMRSSGSGGSSGSSGSQSRSLIIPTGTASGQNTPGDFTRHHVRQMLPPVLRPCFDPYRGGYRSSDTMSRIKSNPIPSCTLMIEVGLWG